MNRRKAALALAAFAAAPIVALDALLGGLRSYGYIVGKNLALYARYAAGDDRAIE